jgi:hypothetical protein
MRPSLLVTLLFATMLACNQGACGPGTQPAPPETVIAVPTEEVDETATHTKAPVTVPEEEGPGPYDCDKDEDCGRTCGGGAMNIQWFLANEDKVPDCKDGCAGKGTGSAICVDGGCVATDRDGNVDEYCTRKLEKTD